MKWSWATTAHSFEKRVDVREDVAVELPAALNSSFGDESMKEQLLLRPEEMVCPFQDITL